MKKKLTRLFSVLLAAVLVFGTLPVSAMGTDVADPPASAVDDTSVDVSAAEPEEEETSAVDETPDGEEVETQSAEEEIAVQSTDAVEGYEMNIFFLDCGRKYYSVDSIEKLIDNAKAAGFNYIQLAVGNDGMRFLLDDMSLTVGDKTYASDDVKAAVHSGNVTYDSEKSYSTDADELTQSEMNEIIAYAQSQKMGVIPCVNTPGHMDAILAAATSLTGTDCSYYESVRTINVTNTTATAFTKAFLQKYIIYFSNMGCKYFNMGADEYANDIFTGGSMGFGNLQNRNKYSYYVTYVNQVAELIENAGMTPMAFNDGIYFKNDTSGGTFDPKIVICYWSQGWNSSYAPATAATLLAKGHKLVNTNGTYYWVLGGDKCTAETAKEFSYEVFARQGSDQTLNSSLGSMFCIWADDPGELTEAQVIANSADTIAAFGNACPQVEEVTETPVDPNEFTITVGSNNVDNKLTVGTAVSMSAPRQVNWTASNDNVTIKSADENVASYSADTTVLAAVVNVEAVKAGEVTITATDPANSNYTASVTLDVQEKETKNITVAEGKTVTVHVDGTVTVGTGLDETIATATTKSTEATVASVTEITSQADLQSGDQLILVNNRTGTMLTNKAQKGAVTSFTGLALAGKPSTADATNVWTWNEITSGTGSLEHGDDGYLNIGNATASVSSNPASIKLAYNSTGKYWTISQNTYYLNQFGGTDESAKGAAGWSGNGASTDEGSRWAIYKYTPVAVAGTDITFTGKKQGTTTVEIGGVIYNITVVDATLADVTPLSIQYWITNARLNGNGEVTTGQDVSINAIDSGIATAAGVDVTKLVDATATRDNRIQEFWQTRLLDTSTSNTYGNQTGEQTTATGDDETNSGSAFTKVRYWDGQWQVYTTEWVTVESKHQLVAYYLEVLDIKNDNNVNELHINAADWGTRGDNNTKEYYAWSEHLCSVSVQLVYPDGSTVNPTKTDFASLKDKTYLYDYMSGGRGIGTMIFNGDNDYQIYKVTATKGEFEYTYTYSSSAINSDLSNQKFTWEMTTDEDNNSVLDEVTVWGGNNQTPQDSVTIRNNKNSPSFEDNLDSLAWKCTLTTTYGDSRNLTVKDGNNAILIRVYVSQKPSEENLHVHYVDEDGGKEFYTYDIKVLEGDYLPYFGMNSDGTLHDNKITNTSDVEETIESDLKRMAQIGAEYRYSNYTLTKAEPTNNGKDVWLYYRFNSTASFVADFGTPLTIKLTDLSANFEGNLSAITNIVASSDLVTVDKAKGTFTYTPDLNFVSSKDGDSFDVTVYGYNAETEKTGNITYKVRIYPASNVLYEENFLNGADDWTKSKEFGSHTDPQETQKAKENGSNYGYDKSYAEIKEENGAWTISGLDTSMLSDPLTTEFYGNTFDLIGNCDKNSGSVLLMITEKGVKRSKLLIIDTRYIDGPIYQVPLAHVDMGKDATYEVEVYASGLAATGQTATQAVATMAIDEDTETYDLVGQILEAHGLTAEDVEITTTSVMQNSTETVSTAAVMPKDDVATYATVEHPAGTHVEINGFRVYRSTTDEVANNYSSAEKDKTYWRILDVVSGEIGAYTETNSKATYDVLEYENEGGPQNEIYLGKDQFIAFKIEGVNEIQVSLSAVSKLVQCNALSENIQSITEMYYTLKADEQGIFTIINTGDNLLAIGNVKLPNNVKKDDITTINEIPAEELSTSVQAARNGNTEEPEVFTPKTFTAKTTVTPVIRNKVVTLKVNVSSDVAYITVNGVKYTRTGLQGLFQATRTIRVVNTVPKNQTKTYEIVAYNADDVASETITVTG